MTDKELIGNSEQLDCSDCVNHGGDWDCDHVQCHKGADTISRAAALEALAEWHDVAITNRLNNLPSAQRWIPCKERMPKPKEYENDVLKYYLVQNEFGDMMVCSWNGKYWEQMYQYKSVRDKVVAWMPLPSPWKGEKG